MIAGIAESRLGLAIDVALLLLESNASVAVILSITLLILGPKIEPLVLRVALYAVSLVSLLVHVLRAIV